MKMLTLITLFVVSTVVSANECKPVDTYFTNVEHVKHCVMLVMNDMGTDKHKIFNEQPDCKRAVKVVDVNRIEIEKLNTLTTRQCFAPYLGELSVTKQIYLIFNNFR